MFIGVYRKNDPLNTLPEEQSYAATAAHLGLVKGYADGTFRVPIARSPGKSWQTWFIGQFSMQEEILSLIDQL
ncbi:S-layer homology domain-containing protein [Paenibacillus taichungensis]